MHKLTLTKITLTLSNAVNRSCLLLVCVNLNALTNVTI